jgi:hypothetical protein
MFVIVKALKKQMPSCHAAKNRSILSRNSSKVGTADPRSDTRQASSVEQNKNVIPLDSGAVARLVSSV